MIHSCAHGSGSPAEDSPSSADSDRGSRITHFLEKAVKAFVNLDRDNYVVDRYVDYLRQLSRLASGWGKRMSGTTDRQETRSGEADFIMQVMRRMLQLFSCISDLLVVGRGGHYAASDSGLPTPVLLLINRALTCPASVAASTP